MSEGERKRVLIVCPGRGAYDRSSLGWLKDRNETVQSIVSVCDTYRRTRGRIPVSALDAEPAFKTALHVAGENASLLTFACALADAHTLNTDRHEVVGVVGNSMGWYTALAVAGALPLEDAVALVDTMGSYQENNVIGGQILYPLTDEDWLSVPELSQAVEEALAAASTAGHVAEWSIQLGGFAVLGADTDGLKFLLQALPKVNRGERTFPLQLLLHSAFHTSLLQPTAARAQKELQALNFRAPEIPLVDGRGVLFRPRTASADELREYTLGHQVVRPYDFQTSVLTALHHCGPDRIVLLGPGNPLGGPVARILVADGWRGVRTRTALEEKNRDNPLLLSFGVTMQRQFLT